MAGGVSRGVMARPPTRTALSEDQGLADYLGGRCRVSSVKQEEVRPNGEDEQDNEDADHPRNVPPQA